MFSGSSASCHGDAHARNVALWYRLSPPSGLEDSFERLCVMWRGQVKQKGRNMFMKIFVYLWASLQTRQTPETFLLVSFRVFIDPLRTSTSYETSQSFGDAG